MNWIKNDGANVPAKREKVLITTNENPNQVRGAVFLPLYSVVNYEAKDVFISEDGGFFRSHQVLAWMPKPAPYFLGQPDVSLKDRVVSFRNSVALSTVGISKLDAILESLMFEFIEKVVEEQYCYTGKRVLKNS